MIIIQQRARACVRMSACVRACVRACVCVCWGWGEGGLDGLSTSIDARHDLTPEEVGGKLKAAACSPLPARNSCNEIGPRLKCLPTNCINGKTLISELRHATAWAIQHDQGVRMRRVDRVGQLLH